MIFLRDDLIALYRLERLVAHARYKIRGTYGTWIYDRLLLPHAVLKLLEGRSLAEA